MLRERTQCSDVDLHRSGQAAPAAVATMAHWAGQDAAWHGPASWSQSCLSCETGSNDQHVHTVWLSFQSTTSLCCKSLGPCAAWENSFLAADDAATSMPYPHPGSSRWSGSAALPPTFSEAGTKGRGDGTASATTSEGSCLTGMLPPPQLWSQVGFGVRRCILTKFRCAVLWLVDLKRNFVCADTLSRCLALVAQLGLYWSVIHQ